MQNEKTLKILMLEDNPDDAYLVERVLSKDHLSFVTERVDTREEFDEAIKTFQPDVVLSDHGLPQFNSREALKICMKERAMAPFILVTGTMSDENAISCLREGADDYILKANLSRLPSAIRRAMKERRLEKLKREARYALRKQNDELIKVNKELDNFVYSVSHNLRGPLASVLGLLQVARMEDKDEKFQSIHGMMEGSISRLDETLKEILDYSRNARVDIQVGEIDWNHIIQSSFHSLDYLRKPNAQYSHAIELQGEVPFYTDGSRLAIVFNTLFSNSMLYRAADRECRIETSIDVSQDSATVSVTDNGIGIAGDCLTRVFDMFYRGTEASSGAGLGLYIARETMKRLNGHIDITSKVNVGTTVILTIPNWNPGI